MCVRVWERGLEKGFWWGSEKRTFSKIRIYYVRVKKAFRIIEGYLEKGTFSEIKNVAASPFIGEKRNTKNKLRGVTMNTFTVSILLIIDSAIWVTVALQLITMVL